MAGFWPAAGWAPWDALTAAGFRCTADARNVAPPIVFFEVSSQTFAGAAGAGCAAVEGVVTAHCIGPPPDNGDARKWAWTGPVPVLFTAGGTEAAAEEFEGLPCVDVSIPVGYEMGVAR